MGYSTIRYEIDDGLATLTLDRPEQLNAFTPEMHAEIRDALDGIQNDGAIRALLITGAGRGFCSGADLRSRDHSESAPSPDLDDSLEKDYNPLVHRLRALEKPVIAAVNGVAAGAGANVALACDIVIAARSASFIQAFVRVGLVPDAGGTWHLPRLVGAARARGLAMLGEPLQAEEAARWGLIWKCVDDAVLMAEATTLGHRLAAGPTLALGLMKRAFNASDGNDLDAQLDLESRLQNDAGQSEDYREGVLAFREKRPARFRGR
jgi:2-(1,2-epoxy-1,2-dihydrophenyl)acetyl-CoA isomerase